MLRIGPCSHIHIVETDLTLVALAANISLHGIIVLLRAGQVLCLLLVQLLRVALVSVLGWHRAAVLRLTNSTVTTYLPICVVVVEIGVQLNRLVH